MADAPRRLPQRTDADRVKTVTRRMAGGSDDGQTATARPVRHRARREIPRGASSGNVITGDTSGAAAAGGVAIAIESTDSGNTGSTTIASGIDSISLGVNAEATGDQSVAYGYSAAAPGANCAALGPYTTADGVASVATGTSAVADGQGATAAGFEANAYGDFSTAIGFGSEVGASGSPVASSTAINGAHVTEPHQVGLGTVDDSVVISGSLVLRDSAGGLWRLAVDTSGTLTTVSYP